MKFSIEFSPTELIACIEDGSLYTLAKAASKVDVKALATTQIINHVQQSTQKQETQESQKSIVESMPITPVTPQTPVQSTPVPQSLAQPVSQQAIPVTPQTPTQPVPTAQSSTQPAHQQTAPVSAVPTSAPTYTVEQLAVAATQLVDAGKISELRGILQSFGVSALTELPKERYGEFATVLRQVV